MTNEAIPGSFFQSDVQPIAQTSYAGNQTRKEHKMNMYPQLTSRRSSLIDKFYALQMPARRDLILAKLTGRSISLSIFPEQAPQKSPNRKFIGAQEIAVAEIIGTLNRHNDFDNRFRPLKSYLRDRWVNVYLSYENGGWAPILVYKVGDKYYVEDGHHRVSVARSLGIGFIQANVWQYQVEGIPVRSCQHRRCPQRSCEEVYAAP